MKCDEIMEKINIDNNVTRLVDRVKTISKGIQSNDRDVYMDSLKEIKFINVVNDKRILAGGIVRLNSIEFHGEDKLLTNPWILTMRCRSDCSIKQSVFDSIPTMPLSELFLMAAKWVDFNEDRSRLTH